MSQVQVFTVSLVVRETWFLALVSPEDACQPTYIVNCCYPERDGLILCRQRSVTVSWVLRDSSGARHRLVQWLSWVIWGHRTVAGGAFSGIVILLRSWNLIQSIPLGVTSSKVQNSKLERLFCHVSVKRDVQALSFEIWISIRKCHPKWDCLYLRPWIFLLKIQEECAGHH